MKFTDYLNESLPQVEGSNLDENIINFVLRSLQLSTQTHVYHLLTKSFAEHVAIGEFYEAIRGNADALAEKSIGMDLNPITMSYSGNLEFKYSKMDLLNTAKDYRGHCTMLINMTNTAELMSINNILINIQTCVDTLMYKLQLN